MLLLGLEIVLDVFIYYFVDSFCIGKRYVMVTYYVTLFASLLINYLPPHHFCLCGIYVTTYVTPTMTSLMHREIKIGGITTSSRLL